MLIGLGEELIHRAADRGDEEGVGGDGTGGESEIEEDRGGSDAGAGIGIAADDDAGADVAN